MAHAPHLMRFCGELQERGLYLERLLVLENTSSRCPQPIQNCTPSVLDLQKLSHLLERSMRDEKLPGDYLVYLMTVQRRLADNAGLAVASALSKRLKKPLLIVEAMSGNAPWSSERVHSFVGQGAADHAAHGQGYLFIPQGPDPRVDPEKNVSATIDSTQPPEVAFSTGVLSPVSEIKNAQLLPQILNHASAVVCDWATYYIFPEIALRMKRLAAQQSEQAPFLLVDDSGLVPLFKHPKVEAAARFIRPKLAASIAGAERERKAIEGLTAERLVFSQKLKIQGELLLGDVVGKTHVDAREYGLAMSAFAGVSTRVPMVSEFCGGDESAKQRLQEFILKKIHRYGEERNHPDEACSSQLSPWLHFGMIQTRTILAAVAQHQGAPGAEHIDLKSSAGKFIDELVTWRELGQNMSHFAYTEGVALGNLKIVPKWAADTLTKFAPPASQHVSLERLEAAESPDPLWNAAQRELLRTGLIQNYMRMLWGKGIIRWSAGPADALQKMEYLNNKYALDGRDPNSYTGIYWCLGKFDRPWPPAREPFGLVRSMSTAAAAKKLKLQYYLGRWSGKEI